MKVTVVGAGNVGAAIDVLAQKYNDVVLVDIKKGLSEGKLLIFSKITN